MRRLAALAILAALTCAAPARADGFEARERAFQNLNILDAMQTCEFLRTGRGHELNPILGRQPSCGKVVVFKTVVAVLHYIVASELNERDPDVAKAFQIGTLIGQGVVVSANIRLVF